MTLGWLAVRMQIFVDLHADFGVPADRLATWLARADGEDDDLQGTARRGAPVRGAGRGSPANRAAGSQALLV